MAGNTFGKALRLTTAGESHGPGYVGGWTTAALPSTGSSA